MVGQTKSEKPKVVLINENKFTVLTFVSDVLITEDSFTIEKPVQSVDILDDSIIYASNSKYFQYYFKDKVTKDIQASIVSRPIVLSISGTQALLTFKPQMMITKDREDTKGDSLVYNREFEHPDFLYGNKEAIYQFYKKQFILTSLTNTQGQIFPVPNVKNVVLIGSELLITTPDQILLVGSVPPPEELFRQIKTGNRAKVEDLLKKQSDDKASQIMIDIFAQFWAEGNIAAALELGSNFLWLADPREFLALCPELVLSMTLRARKLVPSGPALQLSDTANVLALAKMIEFTRAKYDEKALSAPPPYITNLALCLAQCYADLGKTRELDELLKEEVVAANPNPLRRFLKLPDQGEGEQQTVDLKNINPKHLPAVGILLMRDEEGRPSAGHLEEAPQPEEGPDLHP